MPIFAGVSLKYEQHCSLIVFLFFVLFFYKKLLKVQLQHKYLHQEPPTTMRIELSTYGIKICFYEESKELHCLTRCVALKIENLLTSSRYFSELKDLNLDGLAM